MMVAARVKAADDLLRRNIWRSLLILRSASISELTSVVTGLSTRKARILVRDLETHGYVVKDYLKGRLVYSQAVDSPCLPPVCQACGRAFGTKACTPKKAKKQTETETKTETQGQKQRKKRKRIRESASVIIDRLIDEVSHDAA